LVGSKDLSAAGRDVDSLLTELLVRSKHWRGLLRRADAKGDGQSSKEVEMLSLTGAPYVPLHRAAAASGDWTDIVVLFVGMAIAFGTMYVIGRRPAKRQPSDERERSDSNRKAA
jgi:hypothetical protein